MLVAIEKAKVHQLPKKKEPKGMAAPSSDGYYWPPSLYLSSKDYPGIKDWKAGDTVQLCITGKVGSVNVTQREKGKDDYSTELTVTAIADISPGGGGK